MHDLTEFQRDCLYVIAGFDEPYGITLKQELDEYYGTDISNGRLYPNLNRLVEKGLVTKGTINDRTNSYTLTDRGRRELKARREWEDQYLGDSTVQ